MHIGVEHTHAYFHFFVSLMHVRSMRLCTVQDKCACGLLFGNEFEQRKRGTRKGAAKGFVACCDSQRWNLKRITFKNNEYEIITEYKKLIYFSSSLRVGWPGWV